MTESITEESEKEKREKRERGVEREMENHVINVVPI
jgi:hypothetical protein